MAEEVFDLSKATKPGTDDPIIEPIVDPVPDLVLKSIVCPSILKSAKEFEV